MLSLSSLLDRIVKPPKCYDQTARDWIYRGPPIKPSGSDLSGSELTDVRWKEYSPAVNKLLRDPASSEWLEEPIYQHWRCDRKRAPKDAKRDRRKARMSDELILVIYILTWTSLITASLVYPFIASTPEFQDRSPFSIVLFGVW